MVYRPTLTVFDGGVNENNMMTDLIDKSLIHTIGTNPLDQQIALMNIEVNHANNKSSIIEAVTSLSARFTGEVIGLQRNNGSPARRLQ